LSFTASKRRELYRRYLSQPAEKLLKPLKVLADLKEEFSKDPLTPPVLLVEGQNDKLALTRYGFSKERIITCCTKKDLLLLIHLSKTRGDYSKIIMLTDPDSQGCEKIKSLFKKKRKLRRRQRKRGNDPITLRIKGRKMKLRFEDFPIDCSYHERLKGCRLREVEQLNFLKDAIEERFESFDKDLFDLVDERPRLENLFFHSKRRPVHPQLRSLRAEKHSAA
jgi:hypothetical protein